MRLTHDGVSNLEFKHVLRDPAPCHQPRPIPFIEMSTLELLLILRSQGWQWFPLPQKVADRQKLAYEVGKPLHWYTGLSVHKPYLLCLLDAERLLGQHGIAKIPHGLNAESYESILAGRMPPQGSLSNSKERSRKHQQLELCDVDLGESDEDMPPVKRKRQESKNRIQNVEVEGMGISDPQALPPAYDDDDLFAEPPAEEPFAEAEASIGEVAAVASSSRGEQVVAGGAEESYAPEAVEVEGPVQPPVPPAEPVEPPEARGPRAQHKLPKWGSFAFSRKSAAQAPPFGGIEAICKFSQAQQNYWLQKKFAS